ncbi:MAG: hypothetical protein J6D03_03295 [Clostridia bacterium]|nr:hypothetical protein [Clostridia bacterium]
MEFKDITKCVNNYEDYIEYRYYKQSKRLAVYKIVTDILLLSILGYYIYESIVLDLSYKWMPIMATICFLFTTAYNIYEYLSYKKTIDKYDIEDIENAEQAYKGWL